MYQYIENNAKMMIDSVTEEKKTLKQKIGF